jgi:predicted DNA-binding transcriptional regulator AlpA
MSVDIGDENPYADYVSTVSAAKILGVSTPRVHEFFNRGDFPTGIEIARHKYMRITEVLELKQLRQIGSLQGF